MQTPDIHPVADHMVKSAIDAYRRGIDFEASLSLPECAVHASNYGVYDRPSHHDGAQRIGSTLTVEVRGTLKGRYDSDMLTLAVEEHGPDDALSSSEIVEFLEKLTRRGLWSEDKSRLGGYCQVLNSCEAQAAVTA